MKPYKPHPTIQTLYERAKRMRREQVYAEKAMWVILRDRQLAQYKFRRQYIIGRYIVDFICLHKKFIIELDGDSHKDQKQYDETRTKFLNSLGYRVYRITNDKFLSSGNNLLKEIADVIRKT